MYDNLVGLFSEGYFIWHYTKAGMIARSFKEGNQSDLLTFSYYGAQVEPYSMDIKNAFLQVHKIESDIYVRPPKETVQKKISISTDVSIC